MRLFHGRAEVRHLKSVGPLPLYWDRWAVASPFRRHLVLSDLLDTTGSATELMLDLKGSRRRLAELVRDALLPHLPRRRFTVCARSWQLLDVFEGLPVRRFASAGSSRELRSLLRHFAGARVDGVSVHTRLLDARVVSEIRAVADLVLTWPVNAPAKARELVGLGVDGLISDRIGVVTPVAAGP